MTIKARMEAADHTFVVCAYQQSEYLEQCVQSLLQQTVKSRILLSTSTPNELIRGVAEKYRLPLYVNTGDAGMVQDWNFAYKQASTTYITLAHQDDIYEPAYTARMLRRMEAASRPLIFSSNYYEIRGGQRIVSGPLLKVKRLLIAPLRARFLQRSVAVRRLCIALGNSICCPSVTFAAKNLPREVFTVHFRSNADWQAWERLSRMRGAFCYDPMMLMGHRVHGGSETSKVIGDGQRTFEDQEMFEKFWPAPIARWLAGRYAVSEKSNKEQKL